MALTKDERQICLQIAIRGEVVLREKGKSTDERKAFMARKDVQKELKRIDDEFRDREGMSERAKFVTLVEMSKMLPVAVSIMQQALLTGKKDAQGNPIEPPHDVALGAAKDILDRFDVGAGKFTAHDRIPTFIQNNNIVHSSQSDGSPEAVIQRERVRARIGEFVRKLQAKEVSHREIPNEEDDPLVSPARSAGTESRTVTRRADKRDDV